MSNIPKTNVRMSEKNNLKFTGPILDACIARLLRRLFNFYSLYNEAIIAAITIPKFKLRWLNVLSDTSTIDINTIPKLVINMAQNMISKEAI